LIAKILLENFSPKEFANYYQNLNVSIPTGSVNSLINLNITDSILYADLEAKTTNLNILKDKVSYQLNSDLKAKFQYSLKDEQLGFSGKAILSDSKILGLDFVGPVTQINGDLAFNNSGIYSNNLNANIWDQTIKAKASLKNFNDPLLNVNIFSSLALEAVQGLLKDKLKFSLPGEIKGQSDLYVGIQTKIPSADTFQIHSWLDISKGTLKLKKISSPFERISGRLEFEPNQLKCTELNFTYQGRPYITKFVLTNFAAPGVQLELSSEDLNLESIFAVNNKLFKFAKLEGQYFNSAFSMAGDIDMKDMDSPEALLSGAMEIDLQDIKEPLKKFKDKIEKIKPQGKVHAQFELNGNINDFKACNIEARFASPDISFWGLRGREFFLNYSQEEGIVDIPLMHLSFYDGTIDGGAKINLKEQNYPFWISIEAKDVKIQKLKLDTPAKDKDILGTLRGQTRIDGNYRDLSKISGSGKILVTEGKLWNLNLFKGLGSLVFTKDYFTKIVFREGNCDFFIKDKQVYTDNLILKSDIANLSGPVRVGFDGTIDASLDVEVLDEMVPLTGSFRDVTTAIIGKAGRFGVIKISGTLKEPTYKFKATVSDIIRGIKNTIFH